MFKKRYKIKYFKNSFVIFCFEEMQIYKKIIFVSSYSEIK